MHQSFLNLSVLVKAHLSPPREWGWLFLELVLVPTIQVSQLPENKIKTEVEVNLQPIVSRPVCLGVGILSGAHDQIYFTSLTIEGFLIWCTLSDERMGL
jgi:hypothetical protein